MYHQWHTITLTHFTLFRDHGILIFCVTNTIENFPITFSCKQQIVTSFACKFLQFMLEVFLESIKFKDLCFCHGKWNSNLGTYTHFREGTRKCSRKHTDLLETAERCAWMCPGSEKIHKNIRRFSEKLTAAVLTIMWVFFILVRWVANLLKAQVL